jgi:hypothetical protein
MYDTEAYALAMKKNNELQIVAENIKKDVSGVNVLINKLKELQAMDSSQEVVVAQGTKEIKINGEIGPVLKDTFIVEICKKITKIVTSINDTEIRL